MVHSKRPQGTTGTSAGDPHVHACFRPGKRASALSRPLLAPIVQGERVVSLSGTPASAQEQAPATPESRVTRAPAQRPPRVLQAGEKGRAARVRRLLRGSGWRPGANFLHNSPVCGCAPTSTLPPQIVNPVRAVCLALLHLGAALAPSASAYTGSITRALTLTHPGRAAAWPEAVPARSGWARASSRGSRRRASGARPPTSCCRWSSDEAAPDRRAVGGRRAYPRPRSKRRCRCSRQAQPQRPPHGA